MAECGGERRWCRYRLSTIEHQVGQRTLIVLHEDGTVLEESAFTSPLGAAGEFFPVEHELAGRGCIKARRRSGREGTPRGYSDLGPHAKAFETRNQHPIDAIVRLAKFAGVARRAGDAVGDLPVVEYGSAASRASHDAEAARAPRRAAR